MLTAAILTATLMGGSGMGLSISPAQVTGPEQSHSTFTYTDNGSTTESIRVQAVELKPVMVKGKAGWTTYGEADYATVTPERFTIKPGSKQPITVKMNAKDGKAHQVAILVTADGQSTATGGRISASVGARYVVQGPVSVPKPAGHGLPLLPIGGV